MIDHIPIRNEPDLESTLAGEDNTQPRGCAETFLRGPNNNVNIPVIEPDLFARDCADTVQEDLR